MLGLSDITTAVISSAVVAAVVGSVSSFLTQRYLLVRKAQIDADAVERKALIDYQSLARQRLLESIGPLRMQLLFSAREAVHRINSHALSSSSWNMDPTDHYVRSTIYRVLRPLALAQLVERAMGIADFTVDEDAVGLLRFGTVAERMLSSGEIVRDHPGVDWARQTQHLFRDNLRAAAARLITDEQDRPNVIGYDRFQTEMPDPRQAPELAGLAAIIGNCRKSMTENPIFWLRLVGYAYACRELIREQGVRIGFAVPETDVKDLLRRANDDDIMLNADAYAAAIRAIMTEGL